MLGSFSSCRPLVIATLLAACGGGGGDEPLVDALTRGEYQREVMVDGASREYTLVVPNGVDSGERLPLVLLFHGAISSASTILTTSQLANQANESGFLLAALEGVGRSWNTGVEGRSQPDDVAFAGAVIDDVAAATPTDTARVYAAGFSLGGAMTYRLACQLSNRVAAVMVVSGFISNRDLDSGETVYACEPARPMPVLHVHGLADTCVRFDGGAGTGLSDERRLSIPRTIDDWAQRNECGPDTETTLDTIGAACERRLGCTQGADVELCTLDGHGHVWPSGLSYARFVRNRCGGALSDAIDTNQRFWDFVSRFSLRDS